MAHFFLHITTGKRKNRWSGLNRNKMDYVDAIRRKHRAYIIYVLICSVQSLLRYFLGNRIFYAFDERVSLVLPVRTPHKGCVIRASSANDYNARIIGSRIVWEFVERRRPARIGRRLTRVVIRELFIRFTRVSG